jgi:hypothetical protein
MKIYLVLIVLVLFYCCTEPVNIDIEEGESHIVINSILDAGNDSIYVELSWSQPITSIFEKIEIDDAVVSLSNEKGLIGYFEHVECGKYAINHCPEVYGQYTLTAIVGGADTVSGITIIPPAPDYSVAFFDGECRYYSLDFIANNNENYTYWVSAIEIGHVKKTEWHNSMEMISLYANSILIDDFEVTQGTPYCDFINDHGCYMRIRNTIDKKEENIQFYAKRYQRGLIIDVLVFAADINYDRFMKSFIIYNSNSYSSDPSYVLIDANPVVTYSNVSGGIGLVGSINSKATRIILD